MPWVKTAESRRRDAESYGADYRRNRAIALRRDKWQCQIRLADVCTGRATDCDHIVPRSQGGSNDVQNLRAACKACHKKKTAQEGGGNRRLSDPAPKPSVVW